MEDFESDEEDAEDWNKPVEADIPRPSPASTSVASDKVKQCKQGDHSRVIIHIDIDCFYAQVEMIRDPSLRERPLGIQQKYIIVTSNYPARARGVGKLMLIKDALEKCPELVLVSGEDLTHYREMSYKISKYLQKYCPLVERLGFDENFLDVTNLVTDRLNREGQESMSSADVKGHVYQREGIGETNDECGCGCHERLMIGSQVASDIREGLHTELGISCCAGIAHNKLLSKLVAGNHKPNQQTTLFPEQTSKLLGTLDSVRNIPGIGHSSARRLKDLGIVSLQDLQNADSSMLEEAFGHVAMEFMKSICMGIDKSPVVAFGLPQTLSDEDSFKKCSTVSDIRVRVHSLLLSLLNRLLKDGRLPLTFRVTIRKLANHRYSNRESRQCPIPSHIFSKFSEDSLVSVCSHLEDLAESLIMKMLDVNQPFHLTLINVAFAKLEQKSDNMITSFFSPKSIVKDSINKTIQNVPETCHDAEELSCYEKPAHCTSGTPKALHGDSETNNDKDGTIHVQASNRDSQKKLGLFKWLVKSPSKSDSARSMDQRECLTSEMDQSVDADKYRSSCDISPQSKTFGSGKRKSGSAFEDSKLSKKMKDSSIVQKNELDQQLPDGIDRTVFYELPKSIQKEILTNCGSVRVTQTSADPMPGTAAGTGTGQRGNVSLFKTASNTLTDNGDTCAIMKDIKDTTKLSQDIDLPSMFPSKFKGTKSDSSTKYELPCTSDVKTSSTISTTGDARIKESTKLASGINNKSNGISITNINKSVQSSTNLDTSVTGYIKDSNSTSVTGVIEEDRYESDKIPPGVDRSVFIHLPSEIQKEVLDNWKRSTDQKVSSVPHCKNPKPSTSNNILSYFSKK